MRLRRRSSIEAELGAVRRELANLRHLLRCAEAELAYCRPRSREEWAVLYDVRGYPDKLPCGWCGGPHDEVDHVVLDERSNQNWLDAHSAGRGVR